MCYILLLYSVLFADEGIHTLTRGTFVMITSIIFLSRAIYYFCMSFNRIRDYVSPQSINSSSLYFLFYFVFWEWLPTFALLMLFRRISATHLRCPIISNNTTCHWFLDLFCSFVCCFYCCGLCPCHRDAYGMVVMRRKRRRKRRTRHRTKRRVKMSSDEKNDHFFIDDDDEDEENGAGAFAFVSGLKKHMRFDRMRLSIVCFSYFFLN